MEDDAFNARIDRLTERHEALTQSCEMLLADSRLQSEQIAKTGEQIDKLLAESRLHSEQLAIDGENIRDLAQIARAFHERIERLEGGAV